MKSLPEYCPIRRQPKHFFHVILTHSPRLVPLPTHLTPASTTFQQADTQSSTSLRFYTLNECQTTLICPASSHQPQIDTAPFVLQRHSTHPSRHHTLLSPDYQHHNSHTYQNNSTTHWWLNNRISLQLFIWPTLRVSIAIVAMCMLVWVTLRLVRCGDHVLSICDEETGFKSVKLI